MDNDYSTSRSTLRGDFDAVFRTAGVAERGIVDFLGRTGVGVLVDATLVRLVPALLAAVADVLVRFAAGFFAGVAATRLVLLALLGAAALRLGFAVAALRAALARAAAAPRRGGLAASTAGS